MIPEISNVKNVTVVRPTNVTKQIEENKAKYGKRIKQLKVIINDLNYLSTGNTYREFIIDMSSALVHGRKITPKMELAITKIVKRYSTRLRLENDIDYQRKKSNFIEESLAKIGMVKRLLKRAKYTRGYTDRSMYFLNSVEDYLKKDGKLSVKQRKALNSMYKRFEKRVNTILKKGSGK
jgi:hypothetical protein